MGQRGSGISSDRRVRTATAVAVLAGLATGVAHLLDFWLLDLRSGALDADVNWSISDTVSVLAILAAAGSVSALAVAWRRPSLGLLAVLLFFFTADDAVQLHLHLGRRWEELYLPLFVPAVALLWSLSGMGDRRWGALIRRGVVVLGVSVALGGGGWLLARAGWDESTWQFQLKVAVKQGAELTGWMLIAWGAAAIALGRSPTEPDETSREGNEFGSRLFTDLSV